VSKSKSIAAIGGAIALVMTVVHPAAARDLSTAPSAAGYSTQSQGRGPREQRTTPAPTPEQIIASAQAVATAASVDCQVTEAIALGRTATQDAVYEAVCATGPGYLLVNSTPPLAGDCVLLASQAITLRAQDPAADVGQQCSIPANLDIKAVIGGYAREAGINCTVDEALAIGRNSAGNLLYEVGCQNEDGYWLEKTASGWNTTACWEIVNQTETCRFSTVAESNSAWTSVLAGTTAAACDVQQTRLMGKDAAQLKIYEIKCASGEGYLARIDAERKAQRIHTCAEAVNIGGGCQIGVAPAATTEDAPAASTPGQ